MNRRPLFGALALVLALGLIGAGWWLGRNDAAATRATGAVDASTASPDAASPAATIDVDPPASPSGEILPSASSGNPATAAATVAPDPLPAADTPVADVFDALLARAQRGDERAACRLATELQRCQIAADRREAPMDVTAMISREDDTQRRDGMIDMVARYEEERDRSQRVCAGITPSQLEQAFGLQMQAAQAAPELRVWAALQPALDQRFFVNELEQWQQYQTVALPWLEAAAAQGDLAAVVALARVHGDTRRYRPRNPPLRQIDDSRSLIYFTLMERYGIELEPVQNAAEQARARLDPAQLADIDRQVAALFRPEAVLPQEGREASMRAVMRRTFEAPLPAAECE